MDEYGTHTHTQNPLSARGLTQLGRFERSRVLIRTRFDFSISHLVHCRAGILMCGTAFSGRVLSTSSGKINTYAFISLLFISYLLFRGRNLPTSPLGASSNRSVWRAKSDRRSPGPRCRANIARAFVK